MPYIAGNGAIWAQRNTDEIPEQFASSIAGLAAAKAQLVTGGAIQMPDIVAVGSGWSNIGLVLFDASGRLFLTRFHMADGDDPTKRMFWDAAAIATGTIRTATLPDYDGFLLLPSSLGSSGQFLRSNGAGVQPSWSAVAVSNDLLDGANHTDTVARAVTRGDVIVGVDGPAWDRLVIGAAGMVLTSDGTDVGWSLNPAVQHDTLAHLKPFSVANVNWNRSSAALSTSGGGFANVKVGDYILLGQNVTASTQGAKVTIVTDTNNITTNLTKSAGDPSDLSGVTVFVVPGDHFNDTGAVDSNGDGVGLLLTGGRGTYSTGNTSGSFQELRGPIRWRGQGQSYSTFLPSDFRVATSASVGTRSGFCFDGTPSGAAGKVYWFVNASLGSDTTILIPDLDPSAGSDTLVFTGLAQTVTAKTLTGATKIAVNGLATQMVFQTAGGADRMAFNVDNMTALRQIVWQNYGGSVGVWGAPVTFADGDLTPSVSRGNVFLTANTGATAITNFDDGVNGQEMTVIFGDAVTTIADAGNFKLTAAVTSAADLVMRFVLVGSTWYETYRGQC